MTVVTDHSHDDTSGLESRSRFRQRLGDAMREAVRRAVKDGKIGDIGKDGVQGTIPRKDLAEPRFHHKPGGVDRHILTGNNHPKARFKVGDVLGGGQQQGQGKGRGGQASDNGEGEDGFPFTVTKDEIKKIILEGLDLPNLIKQSETGSTQTQLQRSGYSNAGPFNKLALQKSFIKKKGRESAVNHETNARILELLQEEKAILSAYGSVPPYDAREIAFEDLSAKAKIEVIWDDVRILEKAFLTRATEAEQQRIAEIQEELAPLVEHKLANEMWVENHDLRFRHDERKPKPISKAVVICVMDVSGSMTEHMKELAKRFYLLMEWFLESKYQQVDIRFVRHTHLAQEVDEETFFRSRETGGTVVSTALEETLKIVKKDYDAADWNIYVAQTSDGDNVPSDNPKTAELMGEILRLAQCVFYLEVRSEGGYDSLNDVWKTYQPLAKQSQFAGKLLMEKADDLASVYAAFRKFLTQPDASTGQYRAASMQALRFG
ncbi:MAG: YeaH/YhbH family protein [Alphaproteobacteria bacterium]